MQVGTLCAAAVLIVLAPVARATCVIAPDGKSISIVTDNATDDEKNCAVKCQVDTKIGVTQISCGGNTPPRAKAHALCDFDKPEPYYKKVLSFEDSCKGTPGAASLAPATTPAAAPNTAASDTAAPKPAALKPDAFACRIAADGITVEAVISNPYKSETSCQVNCQMSTTRGGTFQTSCTRNVAGNAEEIVCSKPTDEKGKLVKMVGGSGSCVNQEVPEKTTSKDDDEAIDALMKNPGVVPDSIRRQLPPEARKMLEQMKR